MTLPGDEEFQRTIALRLRAQILSIHPVSPRRLPIRQVVCRFQGSFRLTLIITLPLGTIEK
jgi:hypothetical protein